MPVTSLNRQLLLGLSLAHTLLDTMVDTRSVSDDQGRSRICLCLCDGLHTLIEVRTHGNLRHIYITVAHGDGSQVFLLGVFTAGCELSDRSGRSCLGGLSAGVGVNLGIEYHDVDILAGSQHMVHAAESDIICPSVAAEDPLGLLSEEFLVFQDRLRFVASACLQSCHQLVRCRAVGCAASVSVKPLLSRRLHVFLLGVCSQVFHFRLQTAADRILRQQHTITELSRILKQGVGPCRTLTLLVHGVRCGR